MLVLGGSGQGISLPRSVEGRAVSTFVKIRDVWLVPGTTGARVPCSWQFLNIISWIFGKFWKFYM